MGHVISIGGGPALSIRDGRMDLGEGAPPFITGAASFDTDDAQVGSYQPNSPNPELNWSAGNTLHFSKGIFSAWFEINRLETVQIRNIIGGGNNNHFRLGWDSANGRMQMFGRNPSGSAIRLDCDSSTTYGVDAGVWHHILVSYDMDLSTILMYIDDVDVTSVVTMAPGAGGGTSGLLRTDHNRWAISGTPQNSARGWPGCLSEVYMALDQYLDLSVEGNRRKFIDGGGNAVYLGDTGELPTGSPAHLYHRLNTGLLTGVNSNQGGGGPTSGANNDFNATFGTITTCGNAPPTP